MRFRMVSCGSRYIRPMKVRCSRAVRLSNSARSSGTTPIILLASSACFGSSMFNNLTAREHLTFIGRMYLLPHDTIRKRIDELLSLLGLQNEEKKLTLEYSHGMKKKLALAAALLPNPDLLFLDEPFEGVDAITSRVIREMLAGYVERGSTVFLTSHVLDVVERMCTHVGIIAKGKLVEQGSLDE